MQLRFKLPRARHPTLKLISFVMSTIAGPAHIQRYFAGRNVMLTLHSVPVKEMKIQYPLMPTKDNSHLIHYALDSV